MNETNLKKRFTRPRLRASLIALLGTLILLILHAAGALPGVTTPAESLEFISSDQLFRLRGAQSPDIPLIIVAIDDFSFNWNGLQWPWPRDYLSKIVRAASEDGAKVIGLDILLSEPSPDPQADEALADAIRQAENVVSIGQITNNADQQSSSLTEPLKELQEAGMTWGITGVLRDEDIVVRRAMVYDRFADDTYYNWAFELARIFLGPTSAGISAVPLERYSSQQAAMRIDYSGPRDTFDSISAALVAEGRFEPGMFRNKIVLLGATTESLHDTFGTPFSSQTMTPGVEINANIIQMIVNSHWIKTAPSWYATIWIVACLLLSLLFIRFLNFSRALWITLLLSVGYLLFWYLAFAVGHIQTALVIPEFAIVLVLGLPLFDNMLVRLVRFRRVQAKIDPLLATAGDLDALTNSLIPALTSNFQFDQVDLFHKNPRGDQFILASYAKVGELPTGLPVEHFAVETQNHTRLLSNKSSPIFREIAMHYPQADFDGLYLLYCQEVLSAVLGFRLAAGADLESETELLRMLSGALSLAVRNAYLVEDSKIQAKTARELEIARQIQFNFLPEGFPQNKHCQIAAYYQPALQVGGDFYDVIPLEDGKLAIIIADVSGKGVPAALFMALSRSYIRVYSKPKGGFIQGLTLENVMRAVNDSLLDGNKANMFVTTFYGVFELEKGSLEYINAGHNPPLLLSPGNTGRMITGNGMALGVFEWAGFETNRINLEPGQVVVFYTDGVTEARNQTGDCYGEERLLQAALACMGKDAEGIVAFLRQDMEVFMANADQADDITLLVLRVL